MLEGDIADCKPLTTHKKQKKNKTLALQHIKFLYTQGLQAEGSRTQKFTFL